MTGGFEKFFDSADKAIERTPQGPESDDRSLSMDTLRGRLDEVLPPPSDEGGRANDTRMQDPVEQHPKEVTLDDGTVVTLPAPPDPILHSSEICGSETGQSESPKDTRDESGQNSAQEDCTDGNGVDVSSSGRNDTKESKSDLTDEQKDKIREETGWPDEIIDAIGSMEEYEIYKNAGLVVKEVNGKVCLVRPDIDWEQKDAMGRTNAERAEQGLSPIDKDGNVIELHHIGQHTDSPLAELTPEEHRGKGNDTILHDKAKESEIDRNAFGEERRDHWKSRAEEDNK